MHAKCTNRQRASANSSFAMPNHAVCVTIKIPPDTRTHKYVNRRSKMQERASDRSGYGHPTETGMDHIMAT